MNRLRPGKLGFKSQQGQRRDYFLFATASRPTLGPTQPPIQRVLTVFSWWLKRQGR